MYTIVADIKSTFGFASIILVAAAGSDDKYKLMYVNTYKYNSKNAIQAIHLYTMFITYDIHVIIDQLVTDFYTR